MTAAASIINKKLTAEKIEEKAIRFLIEGELKKE
jgi:hypothetical protein